MELHDVIISRTYESKTRQFSFVVLVKEEDISLDQKEILREACRNGLGLDVALRFGTDSSPNPETGEITS